MSRRIDKSWVVSVSIENDGHDRCVDVFRRPDATYGFEEFRRDVEDAGAWTPTGSYVDLSYRSSDDTYDAACRAVPWLAQVLRRRPASKRPFQGE